MAKPVFAREATGLVRQIGFLDNVAISFQNSSLTSGIVFSTFALWLLPGASIPLSLLIAGALLLVSMVPVYTIFAASMPRSGGDYIFTSRTLHPSLGFGGSFVQLFANIAVIGYSTIFLETFLANAAVSIGLTAKNSALVLVGTTLAQPTLTLIIGSIVIIGVGLLSIFSTRSLLGIIRVMFFVTLISVVVAIVALINVTPSTFSPLFNSFVRPFTNSTDSYHAVISTAQSSGYTVPPFSWGDTIKAVPLAITWMQYTFWPTYIAGEFKNASSVRRQYFSIAASLGLIAILGSILLYLTERAAGHTFLASMFYVYANKPSALPLPAPPYYNLFAAMVTNNVVIAAITSIGFVAGGIALTCSLYPALSRLMLAYSFDRIFPSKIGNVSTRFGTPYVAIIICMVVGLVLLVINTFVTTALFVYLTLGSIYIAIAADSVLTSLSGAVFPYLRRSLFDTAPASKYKIGRLPIITIAGIIGVILFGTSAVAYFTDPAYGISTIPWYEVFLISTFVVPALLYFAIRQYRRSRGIDMDAAFSQIPPE